MWLLLFIALLSLAGFTQAVGQVNVWIPRGPQGGSIGRPAINPRNPGTIYASAGGRLYLTTDAAGHWNDLGWLMVGKMSWRSTSQSCGAS